MINPAAETLVDALLAVLQRYAERIDALEARVAEIERQSSKAPATISAPTKYK